MMEVQALSRSRRGGNAGRRANQGPEMEVTRTLVKSPPELWAELSDVDSLARHLGEFGDDPHRPHGARVGRRMGGGPRLGLRAARALGVGHARDADGRGARGGGGRGRGGRGRGGRGGVTRGGASRRPRIRPPADVPVISRPHRRHGADLRPRRPRRQRLFESARLLRRREREARRSRIAVERPPEAGREPPAIEPRRAAGPAPARRGGRARSRARCARLRPPPALLALTHP